MLGGYIERKEVIFRLQYFIPQLLIEGLVIMERVNKLQIWDRLGLSSNIE